MYIKQPTGLLWMPSCAQLMTSKSSSIVPYPPGKAMKASEWRLISAFLWCMLGTAIKSPMVSPVNCMYVRKNTNKNLGTINLRVLKHYLFAKKRGGYDPDRKMSAILEPRIFRSFYYKKILDSPKNISPATMNGLRDKSHEPYAPTAVNKINFSRNELIGKLNGSFLVTILLPGTTPTENA